MNECFKHGLNFDMDDCPCCAREEYESRFQAECYKNAEERYRTYINELRDTIQAQANEIKILKQEIEVPK